MAFAFSVVESDEQVEADGLVFEAFARDGGVLDLDRADGSRWLEHGLEAADEGELGVGARGEEELEDDVEGGIEAAAHVCSSAARRGSCGVARDVPENVDFRLF